MLGDIEPVSRERPTSRHYQKHKAQHKRSTTAAVPIDKLVFLTQRVDRKLAEAAVLVSSQAGVLKFWSIFGTSTRYLLGDCQFTFKMVDYTSTIKLQACEW